MRGCRSLGVWLKFGFGFWKLIYDWFMALSPKLLGVTSKVKQIRDPVLNTHRLSSCDIELEHGRWWAWSIEAPWRPKKRRNAFSLPRNKLQLILSQIVQTWLWACSYVSLTAYEHAHMPHLHERVWLCATWKPKPWVFYARRVHCVFLGDLLAIPLVHMYSLIREFPSEFGSQFFR